MPDDKMILVLVALITAMVGSAGLFVMRAFTGL
jgi:hypothetical protein